MKSSQIRIRKSLPATGLLLAFLVPYVLTGFFWCQLQSVKHEMKERLEREKMVRVEVKAAEIVWVKPGKECWIGQRMFDVKQCHKKGSYLLLEGLYDEDEKALKLDWHQHLKNDDSDKKTSTALGLIFYFGNARQQAQELRHLPTFHLLEKHTANHICQYPNGYAETPERPPGHMAV